MSIFAFGASSSPSNSFPMLLIHPFFLLTSLGCHILLQFFCFLVIRLLVCLRAISLYLQVEFFFYYFGISYFVSIILSCLHIFLVCLPSPVTSDLFPQVVFSFSLRCFFVFVPTCSSVFLLLYHF